MPMGAVHKVMLECSELPGPRPLRLVVSTYPSRIWDHDATDVGSPETWLILQGIAIPHLLQPQRPPASLRCLTIQYFFDVSNVEIISYSGAILQSYFSYLCSNQRSPLPLSDSETRNFLPPSAALRYFHSFKLEHPEVLLASSILPAHLDPSE